MNKRILVGSTIILGITATAILWHNFKNTHIDQKPQLVTHNEKPSAEQKFLLHGPININEATLEELEAIPHIGPSLARKIYDYIRQKEGILDINELLEIKGIGPGNIKIISQYIYSANKEVDN